MGWRMLSDGIKVIAPMVLLKAYTFAELTDDRAQSLEDMQALPGPAQSTKPSTQKPAAQPNGPVMASKQKMDFIVGKMGSLACPAKLRANINKWYNDHNGQVSDEAASKTLAKLNEFHIDDRGKFAEPATDKQIELLRSLLRSSAVPVDIGDDLESSMRSKGIKNWTKGAASAWIACCEWYIQDAKVAENKTSDQQTKDDQAAFEDYQSRRLAVQEALKVKEAPDANAMKEIAGWLRDGPDTEAKLAHYESVVASWPDKPVVQEDVLS